jgi:streptomycin 6-kinase
VNVDLPDAVRRKAEVAGADKWLADLPELVAALERDWAITVGPTFAAATEAYVAQAVSAHGEPAVLKVLVPRAGDVAANEATVLRLAGGNGCVRLLRDDLDRGALLLERLGRSMYELKLPIRRRHEVLCDVAARVWRPAPDCGLPTGADKAQWLIDFIGATWKALARPCSERTVEHALECAARRITAHDDERARLVHGDVQQWNTLEAKDGFALVDPDGLLADPEYDLGIIMREDPIELMRDGPHERARWLAERTALDAKRIWEWGVIERLATGLLAISIGLQPIGDQMVRAAEAIADRAGRDIG